MAINGSDGFAVGKGVRFVPFLQSVFLSGRTQTNKQTKKGPSSLFHVFLFQRGVCVFAWKGWWVIFYWWRVHFHVSEGSGVVREREREREREKRERKRERGAAKERSQRGVKGGTCRDASLFSLPLFCVTMAHLASLAKKRGKKKTLRKRVSVFLFFFPSRFCLLPLPMNTFGGVGHETVASIVVDNALRKSGEKGGI